MMHGAQIVSEVKHRMHVTNHFDAEPWTIKIRGHVATICPSDDNAKWVYYRKLWFRVIIDDVVSFENETPSMVKRRWNDAYREAIETYIDDHHIQFEEEK